MPTASGHLVAIERQYAPYARETALCVDFAYDAMEADINAERDRASGATREALTRLLDKLKGRRSALKQFTELAAP
jgi:hypothetical protein